jgi:hypothetical protein
LIGGYSKRSGNLINNMALYVMKISGEGPRKKYLKLPKSHHQQSTPSKSLSVKMKNEKSLHTLLHPKYKKRRNSFLDDLFVK